MLLVQCTCGNYATLDNDFFSRGVSFCCPNCQTYLKFYDYTEIRQMHQFLVDGFKLYALPDNTTLDFKFSVSKVD